MCFQICAGKTGFIYIPAAFECECPSGDETGFFLLPTDVISPQKTNRECFLLILGCQLPSACAITHTHTETLTDRTSVLPLKSVPLQQCTSYVSCLSTTAHITFPQLPLWCVMVPWKSGVAANQQRAEIWCSRWSCELRYEENPLYELSILHFRIVYSCFGI